MSRQARLPRPFGRSLALRRPPLCSEIGLWLIAEDVDLEAGCRELHEGESPPYWAFCWGSGQALARFLLDHPAEARGRRVVDFGCGSGVAGIAAGMTGAREVVAVDVDPTARAAAAANAALNGLAPGIFRSASRVPDDWDLLLASDVLYEASLRPVVEVFRRDAAARGATVLAGEPQRPGNPGHPDLAVAEYAVRTLPDVDSPTVAAKIYRLSG